MKNFNFCVSYSWKGIFLSICFFTNIVDSHILVYRKHTNQLIEEFNDLPALFGANIPGNGIQVNAIPANPIRGCGKITAAPIEETKHVAIIQRGGENCSFELKVRNAQAANFDAVIVYNNVGEDLEQMSATNSCGINIPAVFVGQSTGIRLISQSEDTFLVINDELPFNINTQLILPFTILIGLCFLIMIFYMIYKCVREERRLRQYRLPKSMLKKIPITKFTKNNDLSYDTCVICLEEFVEGDKLRILLCKHPYHSHCIDPWLTKNRRVCPVCKRKVFAKGEVRTSRNRQSSLDSGDTDDDTTPLLRPVENLSSNHGTFSRNVATQSNSSGASVSSVADDGHQMSDEENVLLTHPSRQQNSGRVNPFDRAPNLPPNLADQLNNTGRRSMWLLPIFRLFHRNPSISVSAQPIITSDMINAARVSPTITEAMTSARIPNPQELNTPSTLPSSNNILNPNLSGSFKDDEIEAPHQSIYEPIAVATPYENPQGSITQLQSNESISVNLIDPNDSIFFQTPSHGGIGVAALPNPNAVLLPPADGGNISSRSHLSTSDRRQFLV